jgi:predicted O-methyltransferase YrrM
MDAASRLVSVDNDDRVQRVARAELGADPRVTFHLEDGGAFLGHCRDSFDLIFADAWTGKFSHLSEALDRVAAGGIYVIDDLLPQPNWPPDHESNVAALVERLCELEEFEWSWLEWSTGVGLVVRT